jgi:Protein of unknown function (DUF2865)
MTIRRFAASFAAGLLLAGIAAGGADAGLLDFLFGPKQRPQPVSPPPMATQPQVQHPRTSSPGPVATASRARGYCVRTCDGYYFATGFIRNQREQDMQATMCESSCTGGQMALYTATVNNADSNGNTKPAIESAVDATGNLYTALPSAYAFRNGDNPACTCQSTARGLPQIPISVDPTLRNGDIVVMPDGLKVFRGASDVPHEDGDFTSVASSKALPGVVRQEVLSLEQRIAPQ